MTARYHRSRITNPDDTIQLIILINHVIILINLITLFITGNGLNSTEAKHKTIRHQSVTNLETKFKDCPKISKFNYYLVQNWDQASKINQRRLRSSSFMQSIHKFNHLWSEINYNISIKISI